MLAARRAALGHMKGWFRLRCTAGEEEETEQELMARLGLKLEEELAQLDADKALDARLAQKWGARECARDKDQWQPLRSMPEPDADRDSAYGGAERALDFEDINDFVFSLGVAQQHLLITSESDIYLHHFLYNN